MNEFLRGAFIAAFGDVASAIDAPRFAAIALSLGAVACTLDDPRLTHVVRGEQSTRLSKRIGPSARERELIARGSIVWIDEAAFLEQAALASAPVDPTPQDTLAALRARLANLASTDDDARYHLAREIASHRTGAALALLAEAVALAPSVTHFARAFGLLAAGGVTRFDRPSPIAVECPLRRSRSRDPIESLARSTGAVENFCDDDGHPWLRTRIARVPRIPPERAAATRVPFVALVQRVARRRRGRVWIAGCELPARVPLDGWMALLAPIGER